MLVDVGGVGLDGEVLLKLRARVFVVLLADVGHAQVIVHQRQLRIGMGSGLQLAQRVVVLAAIQMRFADDHAKFGSALPNLGHARVGFVGERSVGGKFGGAAEHV